MTFNPHNLLHKQKCKVCGNQLKKRQVSLGYIGALCTEKFKEETYCWYCEWKGTSGKGKMLRDLIKDK